MSTEAAGTPAKRIAAGYAVEGQALELGTVVVDGEADPTAQIRIPLATINRHGLVAGATGTGKTKTLQLIAEQLSAAGVPVLMADVKGDLSGLSRPGEANDKTAARAKDTGDNWMATGFPVEFLSLGTDGVGVPIRATVASFGPVLLSKVLGLNATQESTLGLIFHWANGENQQRPLVTLDQPARRHQPSDQRRRQGRPEIPGRSVVHDGRRHPASAGEPRRRRRRHVLRRAEARSARPPAHRPGPRHHHAARVQWSVGAPGHLLHLPDVVAGRPVHAIARGRRHPEAQAGVLLRRGAPVIRRRLEGIPGSGRADGQADPLQGRRGVLLHPAAHRPAQRCAIAAGSAHSARAAGVHLGRPEGAEQDRPHLPENRCLRPRISADLAGYRRGHRHRAVGEGCADTRRMDAHARSPLADGRYRP